MDDKNMTLDESKSAESKCVKVFGIVKTVFTYLIMLLAVAMMIFTVISVNTFDRNDRDLFGYKAFIVRTDSMKATDFDAGDLVLIKEVAPTVLEEGDIIAFRSSEPNTLGETFTHKIRSKTITDEGAPAFITYGTTTGVNDTYPVAYDQIMGKYQFSIPGLGNFFTFLKTVPGYICCILLPFMLLILLQGINSVRLFRQYKAEQMAELEKKHKKEMEEMAAEREKLEAERAESKQLLEELKEMKKAMSGNISDSDNAENN